MEISEEELVRIQEKIEKLKQSKFKQQMLPAWRPVPSFGSTMIIFGIFGVLFLALGITLYVMSEDIQGLEKRYDDVCEKPIPITLDNSNPNVGTPCDIPLQIDSKIEADIYVYYQLDNFYQNHRRYVKSRSNKQLLGEWLTVDELTDDCTPIVQNKDIGRFYAVDGKTKLDPEEPAFPCGLVAKSLFNDTFELYQGNTAGDQNKLVTMANTNIAWKSDYDNKFFNLPTDEMNTKQWTDIKAESFIVWMRTAGLPNFRKLYGRIESDLAEGDYTLRIINNYDVSSFEGQKHFVLSTTNILGGQNYFLAICYIIVGGLCIMFGIIFFIAYMGRKSQNNNQNAQAAQAQRT